MKNLKTKTNRQVIAALLKFLDVEASMARLVINQGSQLDELLAEIDRRFLDGRNRHQAETNPGYVGLFGGLVESRKEGRGA